MIVDCSGVGGGYSRDGGEPICSQGYPVSQDHKIETQRFTDKRMAFFAASQVRDLAKAVLRREVSRGMDRRSRERCIPDDSTIRTANSPRDSGPVQMATKARNPSAAARAIKYNGFSTNNVIVGRKAIGGNLRKPNRDGKAGRERRSGRARNATATARAATAAAVAGSEAAPAVATRGI